MKRLRQYFLLGLLFFTLHVTRYTAFAEGLPLRETYDEFGQGSFNAAILTTGGITLSPNLVQNGDFEDGFKGWNQNSSVQSAGYSGSFSSKVSASGSGNPQGARCSIIEIENNSSVVYSLGAWLKCDITKGDYYFRLILYDSGGTEFMHKDLQDFSLSSGWVYYFITVGGIGSGATYELPSNCAKVSIDQAWWNGASDPSGDGWMDGIFFMKGVFTGAGIYLSSVYDCGGKTTFGRISWVADTVAGCSVVFNTRAGTTPADVLAEEWSDTYYTSGDEVLDPPGWYFQYRAILYSSSPSISPLLKEVNIGSPVKSLISRPSFQVKAGENISFEYAFNIGVDTGYSPTVTIVSGSGGTLSIPGSTGTWAGSVFTTGETQICGFLGEGFATLKLEGGRTLQNEELFCCNFSVLFIDNSALVVKDKVVFFPDPFSPNGDGKCDETKLMLSVEPSAPVTAKIYNMKGSLIKMIAENVECSGFAQIGWDGKDSYGRIAPVGVYIYQVRIGYAVPVVKTGTVVLAK
ncbi:hypothetical protein COY52_04405 [Candidatus Desantisbacteria bacterium CG_4_10_14_0_8_um_filter_48_22]|uniref:FlgD Ig-like domain-containing protein n=1 Tax=Candidatus Desantisbacteria bacterium CG_4_10_14_0_8_um_filter_48_22 TaxID=1974543 RepID=A0A2M7SD57_9BACT|nr:MAG: hypothetical protein AUJ67_01380 [Candidatus Desantisbacteria bacterium CG1_02_49_89]PIZ17487.1 MAG: hypothetical protein COY52_04405 [Candidatus Desantisbacteria bacterium CG_4_10_14_0_8_um_filter_48_22]